jgi:hypothetical protein
MMNILECRIGLAWKWVLKLRAYIVNTLLSFRATGRRGEIVYLQIFLLARNTWSEWQPIYEMSCKQLRSI